MAARWGTAYKRSRDPFGSHHRPLGYPVPNPQLPGWAWDFCLPSPSEAGKEGGRDGGREWGREGGIRTFSSPSAGDGEELQLPCSWKDEQKLKWITCFFCTGLTFPSFCFFHSSNNHHCPLSQHCILFLEPVITSSNCYTNSDDFSFLWSNTVIVLLPETQISHCLMLCGAWSKILLCVIMAVLLISHHICVCSPWMTVISKVKVQGLCLPSLQLLTGSTFILKGRIDCQSFFGNIVNTDSCRCSRWNLFCLQIMSKTSRFTEGRKTSHHSNEIKGFEMWRDRDEDSVKRL